MSGTTMLSLRAAVEQAQATKSRFEAEKAELTAQFETLFNVAMPIGMQLEKWAKDAPPWARKFNTLRGNDRGTKRFIVQSKITVEVDVIHPDLSKWSCEATPVSEKTGNLMNGSAHGADASKHTTVRICGYLKSDYADESDTRDGIHELLNYVERQASAEGAEIS